MCSLNPCQDLSLNLPAVDAEAGEGGLRPRLETSRNCREWFMI